MKATGSARKRTANFCCTRLCFSSANICWEVVRPRTERMHALLAAGIPHETDPTGMHQKFSHLSSSLYLLLGIVGVFLVVLILKRRKSADQTSAPTCSYC